MLSMVFLIQEFQPKLQLQQNHKYASSVHRVGIMYKIPVDQQHPKISMVVSLARPEHTVTPIMLIPVAKTAQQEHMRIKQHWLRVKHVLWALLLQVQVQVQPRALFVPQARITTIHLARLAQPGGTPIKKDNDLGARVAPWVIPPRVQIQSRVRSVLEGNTTMLRQLFVKVVWVVNILMPVLGKQLQVCAKTV